MVSIAEHCDSTANEDDQQKSVINEEVKKNSLTHEPMEQSASDINNVEKLQCIDKHSINFLASSTLSNDPQSTSTNVEPDDIRLRIVELSKNGLGPVAISRLLGISRQRASRWIRRHEEKTGCVQVQKNSHLTEKPSNITFPESSLPRMMDKIEKDSENSCVTFNDDDIEELQCIDEDSIAVLKSLYMSDEGTPALLKVMPNEDCVRDQIVALHKEGYGPTAIARELGITRQRASRWVKRFVSEGTILTKQRIGRPKKLTSEQKYIIRKFIEEKPYATITEVMTACNLDCSRSTVRTVMKA